MPLLQTEFPASATLKKISRATGSRLSREVFSMQSKMSATHQSRIEELQIQFKILEVGDVAPLPLITGDDLTGAGSCLGKCLSEFWMKYTMRSWRGG